MKSVSVERIGRVRNKMAEQNLPALLVSNITNVRYLTGFTGSNGFVVLTPDRAIFATDSRYTEQAKEQCDGFEQVKLETSSPEEIVKILTEPGVHQIGFEAAHISHDLYNTYSSKLTNGFQLAPTKRIVDDLRMVKDDDEIAAIQKACQLTDRGFEYALTLLKPGVIERDIALELEWFFRKTSRAENAFDIIVASGWRSALPHGRPSEKALEAGDFVTIDFGAKVDGYVADVTRTVVLGQPTDEQRKIYNVVLDAHDRSIEAMVPGAEGVKVDALSRKIIGDAGYGEYFGHGLGHSIGLNVHDGPALGKTSETILAAGMVITVEPGIYIPGKCGVRIEDDVVVTESTPRYLTHSNRELIVL